MSERLIADEKARRYRLTWDEFEARVRSENSLPVPERPLELGQAVAWVVRVNGRADHLSAIHHHFEDGMTFCKLAIPPQRQHIPVLDSLDDCPRCRAMSRRALYYANLAVQQAEMRASA